MRYNAVSKTKIEGKLDRLDSQFNQESRIPRALFLVVFNRGDFSGSEETSIFKKGRKERIRTLSEHLRSIDF